MADHQLPPEGQDDMRLSPANGNNNLNTTAAVFDADMTSTQAPAVTISNELLLQAVRSTVGLLHTVVGQVNHMNKQGIQRELQGRQNLRDELRGVIRDEVDLIKRSGLAASYGDCESSAGSPQPFYVAPLKICKKVAKEPAEPTYADLPLDESAAALRDLYAELDPKNLLNTASQDVSASEDNEERTDEAASVKDLEQVSPDVVPSVEDPGLAFIKANTKWMPLAIRRLAPLPAQELAVIPDEKSMMTFTWDFLHNFFGGTQWNPDFFHLGPKLGNTVLPSRSWYRLDGDNEPFGPSSPGAHGAKLTAFFNPESPQDHYGENCPDALHNFPVFVRASTWANHLPDNEFVYFGMYSQLRFSDRLDYDRMTETVPDSVKMHWAEQLSDPGRPRWITEALKKHFVPKPQYDGKLPGSRVDGEVMSKDLSNHAHDLKQWKTEANDFVQKLSKEDILQAFDSEDAGEPRGLRLWWEYLQCIGWDKGFYDMMLKAQARLDPKTID